MIPDTILNSKSLFRSKTKSESKILHDLPFVSKNVTNRLNKRYSDLLRSRISRVKLALNHFRHDSYLVPLKMRTPIFEVFLYSICVYLLCLKKLNYINKYVKAMTTKQAKCHSQLLQSYRDEKAQLLSEKHAILLQIAERLKLLPNECNECNKYPCKGSGFCFCIPECLDFSEFCHYSEEYKVVQESLEPIDAQIDRVEFEISILEA
jgi:hypothetical protein